MNDWVGFLSGHPNSKTPNLDKLAKDSVPFANTHCPSPMCGLSRASSIRIILEFIKIHNG
ncbi:hypothetical protein K4L44_01975 [Halosquirtibacter laminarini]|uniref:Uncharacterized protein n=2 Tax=Halosquirtibacter laminarini TaxID=3374600 RepID=A0AC61NR51_9BACT|nr:hypothetical protein K4L44_01975 [Prolixibacteraceae bacterium]